MLGKLAFNKNNNENNDNDNLQVNFRYSMRAFLMSNALKTGMLPILLFYFFCAPAKEISKSTCQRKNKNAAHVQF